MVVLFCFVAVVVFFFLGGIVICELNKFVQNMCLNKTTENNPAPF